jgi:hypothetical protein
MFETVMSAYYDKLNKRNKKRIEIYTKEGKHLKRYYDYGSKEYLQRFYNETFYPDLYTVKIFEIGESEV